MPIDFKLEPSNPSTPFIQIQTTEESGYGPYKRPWLRYQTWLGSCGVGWLQDFSTVEGRLSTWEERAEFISLLYRNCYKPGNMFYSLTPGQFKNPAHELFLQLGAKAVTEFPNLTHGPSRITIFHVNIRNAVGRFCNKYGEPYSKPPKDDSEVEPEKLPEGSNWMHLPVRGKD